MRRKPNAGFIVTGAIIAAAYAGLTYLSNVFGLAYGPIQLRISEMLTVLPILTPAAIPGLTVGCFLANIGSFNMLDLAFGTAATLIAALLSFAARGITVKKLPIVSVIMPVIINAVVIGAEISAFYLPRGAGFWGYIISALEVGVGELIVCTVFGIPTYLVAKKYKIFTK